jgi:uncharacterized membrane protein
MANDVRISSDSFKSLGIHQDAIAWTTQQLEVLNGDYFSDDIDNIITLAEALEVLPSDEILTTYTSKSDNQVYFSVPRIHLNSNGEICLFLGSKVEFTLTYDAKTKTYNSASGLSFKVSPYKRDKEKEVRAINFITTIGVEIDGLEEDYVYSIPVKTQKEVDLVELTKALQSGSSITSDQLIQLGAGGSYDISLKPWMLAKGLYTIVRMKQPYQLPEGGKIWEGYVSSVNQDGSISDDQILVSMNSNPFVKNKSQVLVNAALKGANVYFTIDGAYSTSMGTATIGYSSIIANPNEQKIKTFLSEAKASHISVRRANSENLLTDTQIEQQKSKYLAEQEAKKNKGKVTGDNNTPVTSPVNSEDSVTVPATPDFDKIPF